MVLLWAIYIATVVNKTGESDLIRKITKEVPHQTICSRSIDFIRPRMLLSFHAIVLNSTISIAITMDNVLYFIPTEQMGMRIVFLAV